MSNLRAWDDPLPVEMTGRTLGWISRYRRHPVFSAAWVRGRTLVIGLPVLIVVLVIAVSSFVSAGDWRPLGGVLMLFATILAPTLLGPWAGHAVRKQGWAPHQEWRALLAVILGMAALVFVVNVVAAEPFKQWVAEQVGTVDEQGRRRVWRMMIGLSMSSGDASTPPVAMTVEKDPWLALTSAFDTALIAFLLAGGPALWGYQRERRVLQALQRERELAQALAQRREAEIKLSVLAAQIEPHFLFNTLAGVRSAIATDPQRASAMVERLADYLRATIPRLRSDGAVVTTLHQQVDALRAYLGLMAARMPRLQHEVRLPAELAAAKCPPLMLITLAENAIKHGVEPKIGPATVRFAAERDAHDRLRLVLEDDGVGFGESAGGSGIGLANIRSRLQQLYQDRAELTLSARPGGGVKATLTLPLEFEPA